MVKARTRIAMLALATGAAVLLVGCGGSESDGAKSKTTADRRAILVEVPGTVVCIRNASSDTLRIKITNSLAEYGYPNTVGTEDLAPNVRRCMGSNALLERNTALAEITIASGERFTVIVPPVSPALIRVDSVERFLKVGESTRFQVGKHPILAYRTDDVDSARNFNVTIGQG